MARSTTWLCGLALVGLGPLGLVRAAPGEGGSGHRGHEKGVQDPRDVALLLLARIAAVSSLDLLRAHDPFTVPDRRPPREPVRPDPAAVASAAAKAPDARERAATAPDALALATARRARFDALHLSVQGIVLDSAQDPRHRTIVVHDDPQRVGRIYEVGDPIRDGSGGEVPGLSVEWIEAGRVVFRFEGEVFPKELERP